MPCVGRALTVIAHRQVQQDAEHRHRPDDHRTRWQIGKQRYGKTHDITRKRYRAPEQHWDLYQLGEKLTDLEDAFRLWRFRHVTTVERIIGFKRARASETRRPGTPR